MSMIDLVIEQRRRDLGGFEVGRVLPSAQRRMVGPFVFFDHMGPTEFPAGIPRSVDVRPHPHIGLSTVTYLFDGEIVHRDSVASEQTIRPGEVNWMTAGRGITHSERFERARAEGDKLHGIQAWVALPKEQEETGPAFHHHTATELPTYEGGGLWARLIAGEAFGTKAPVKTFSPLFYAHWRLDAGAKAQLPAEYPERAAFIAAGSVEVEGRRFGRVKC
jgi:redox-sensitive bicupin YhaK (pirin superfamily)